MRDYDSEERLRLQQRERRRAELRRQRRRREKQKRILILSCAGIFILLLGFAGIRLAGKKDKNENDHIQNIEKETTGKVKEGVSGYMGAKASMASAVSAPPESETEEEAVEEQKTELPFAGGYSFSAENAAGIGGENMMSTYALLVDLDNNTIVAQKNARERISPASMTKILTVLVAAEHVTNLDDTFTITREITDYSYSNDCSSVGFADGETVTVRDLFYGTVLPSGGDAAAGLAYYVAGSLDGFTELLNEKIAELGLSGSAHFTNCVGLYDENHYCTVYDMAVMLKAAVENDFCREVLSAHTYTTSATEQHPEGIQISNWFLRRIEDKDTHGEVVCAKTGYVVQSGNCAASYAVSNNGKHYICVTADAHSGWRCIYDHVAIYETYTE